MEWYPFYSARYKADTLHLTCEEDGFYRRLIDYYMESKLPLPNDIYVLSRIAGVDIHAAEKAMAKLRVFFSLENGKLHIKKCDEIIAEQVARSLKYAENGKKGGRPKALNGHIEKSNSKAKSNLLKTTRQDKTRYNNKENNTPLPPNGVSGESWGEFLLVRKNLKAKNTDYALKLLHGKIERLSKQGFSPQELVDASIRNSWKDVYEPKNNYKNEKKPSKISNVVTL